MYDVIKNAMIAADASDASDANCVRMGQLNHRLRRGTEIDCASPVATLYDGSLAEESVVALVLGEAETLSAIPGKSSLALHMLIYIASQTLHQPYTSKVFRYRLLPIGRRK